MVDRTRLAEIEDYMRKDFRDDPGAAINAWAIWIARLEAGLECIADMDIPGVSFADDDLIVMFTRQVIGRGAEA